MSAQVVPVDVTTALLVSRLTMQEELIRWLSLPLGDNEPVFAGADGRATVNGQPLGHADSMHRLWHQVMGTEHVEADAYLVFNALGEPVPVENRSLVQCPCCKRWNIERQVAT